jgi:hypothetical protein
MSYGLSEFVYGMNRVTPINIINTGGREERIDADSTFDGKCDRDG